MNEQSTVQVNISVDELRYIIRCGAALAQNVPVPSLPTYCGFDKDQIVRFSAKMRDELERIGEDL
ncbi:hypothetical protein Q4610_16340 [Sphingobium sp. HBC34]|uniref:Uncharacterized protein n=1 Tax=Sphingobium cyanobacteriorum TaxID=3063954 RepID=A0ABT8ZQZ8_9SPHN|nr:hypothetical protein [Sphingobium sp. HBC34]MDO7836616.1 hypothetical protein [Sphingobium sp. HBC34]